MNLDKNNLFQIQKLPYGFIVHNNKEGRDYECYTEFLTDTNNWVRAINCILTRPNKGKLKKTVTRVIGGVERQVEVDDDEEEETLIEDTLEIKISLIIYKTVQFKLKKTTFQWNEDKSKDGQSKNYVLLFTVTKCENKEKKIFIACTDGKEYEFRTDGELKAEKLAANINAQVKAIKLTINTDDLSTNVEAR
jgi:hypothetical protein